MYWFTGSLKSVLRCVFQTDAVHTEANNYRRIEEWLENNCLNQTQSMIDFQADCRADVVHSAGYALPNLADCNHRRLSLFALCFLHE